MSTLEVLLLILIVILSIVFISIGGLLVVVLLEIKKTLERIDRIIQTAENITEDVSAGVKTAASGLAALATKNLISTAAKKLRSTKR